MGFMKKSKGHRFYDICRSQFDVSIDGHWKKLFTDHRGFHWMMAMGGCAKEVAYVCPTIGMAWNNVSQVA